MKIDNESRMLRIVVWAIGHRFFLLALISIACGTSIACPTCIGTIEHNSPKFFTNDAYQSKDSDQDDHTNHNHDTTKPEKDEK